MPHLGLSLSEIDELTSGDVKSITSYDDEVRKVKFDEDDAELSPSEFQALESEGLEFADSLREDVGVTDNDSNNENAFPMVAIVLAGAAFLWTVLR